MRPLLVLVAALALALAPAGSTARGGTASAPRCHTAELVVWLDTHGDGAAGSTYYPLELTNLSSRAYTLSGHPGVSAVGLDGRELGSAAGWTSRAPGHVVTLAPGGTAKAVLRVTNAGNYPRSACRPVTAAGLRVFPPGSTESKVVPFPFRACAARGPVVLHVGAVD